MNELKELCDRLVAHAPPMRDSAAVLAGARRSALRRRAVVGAAATVVVAAATVLTLQVTVHGGPAERGDRVAAPAGADLGQHERRMADLLVAVVPTGYSYTVSRPVPPTTSPRPVPGSAHAAVFVSDGGGRGLLAAAAWPVGSPVEVPPCPDRQPCETVTVDGVAVEVSTWTDDLGRHVQAVRRAGVVVVVTAAQAMRTTPAAVPQRGLEVFPFSTAQIAALAADPAMLPPG